VRYDRFGTYTTSIFDTSGGNRRRWVTGYNTAWKDSIFYALIGGSELRALKISENGDTLWNTPFTIRAGCEGVAPFRRGGLTPDVEGGVYYMYSCQDTIYHFNPSGQYARPLFPGIGSQIAGYVFSDGAGGLVVANESGRALRYFDDGTPRWTTPVTYLSNPGSAYFPVFAGDKNGGVIIAFWTTRGGIFAQQTGRYGQVGIVTSVLQNNTHPLSLALYPNFPNPFNSRTVISYSLPARVNVQLIITDVLGRTLTTLVNRMVDHGMHTVTVDAARWASGVYFYRLVVDGRILRSRKMLLIK